jgi:hypothetical protein
MGQAEGVARVESLRPPTLLARRAWMPKTLDPFRFLPVAVA